MTNIEERLNILEMNMESIVRYIYSMQQAAMGFSIPSPPPRLPFEREEEPVLLTARATHFGLDARQRANWVDVFSRLVSEKKIKSCEVSIANFCYLMCGEGTPANGPIRWYGSTRELAYMVRTQLNSNWLVALATFKDKNNNPLPKTLKNTKAPSPQNMKKIDFIFRTKD